MNEVFEGNKALNKGREIIENVPHVLSDAWQRYWGVYEYDVDAPLSKIRYNTITDETVKGQLLILDLLENFHKTYYKYPHKFSVAYTSTQ